MAVPFTGVTAGSSRPGPPWHLASASTRGRRRAVQETLASTHSWSVHYASDSTESKQILPETGDAGPASGGPRTSSGRRVDHDRRHRRHQLSEGQWAWLRALAGLDSSQPSPGERGQWIEFSTTTQPSHRSSPASAPTTSPGAHPEGAAHARASQDAERDRGGGHRRVGRRRTHTDHVVLFVPRSKGLHVPVKRTQLNAKGKAHRPPNTSSIRDGARSCGPHAPQASAIPRTHQCGLTRGASRRGAAFRRRSHPKPQTAPAMRQ